MSNKKREDKEMKIKYTYPYEYTLRTSISPLLGGYKSNYRQHFLNCQVKSYMTIIVIQCLVLGHEKGVLM